MSEHKRFRFTCSVGFRASNYTDIVVAARDYSNYHDWDDIPEEEQEEIKKLVADDASKWAQERLTVEVQEL